MSMGRGGRRDAAVTRRQDACVTDGLEGFEALAEFAGEGLEVALGMSRRARRRVPG